MSHPTDIKPIINASSQAIISQPRRGPDVKPNLSELPETKPLIDFEKERAELRRQFERDNTILDLQEENRDVKEENRRLKARQRWATVHSGIEDVKPDISRSGVGIGQTVRGKRLQAVESDDDDVVFIREVKAVRSRRVKPSE